MDIKNKIKWAQETRARNSPTVPSTIGEEKLINPFMRVHVESVQRHVKQNRLIETMGALRNEKNYFKAKWSGIKCFVLSEKVIITYKWIANEFTN